MTTHDVDAHDMKRMKLLNDGEVYIKDDCWCNITMAMNVTVNLKVTELVYIGQWSYFLEKNGSHIRAVPKTELYAEQVHKLESDTLLVFRTSGKKDVQGSFRITLRGKV